MAQSQIHKPDENFVAHVQSLQEAAAILAASVDGGQRLHTPPPSLSGDPSDPTACNHPFDRSAIGQDMELAVLGNPDAGTVADVATLKLQNDFIAARETAYRSAHASTVRCAIHAAARRRGHASPSGVFGNGVLRYAQDLIQQGTA